MDGQDYKSVGKKQQEEQLPRRGSDVE